MPQFNSPQYGTPQNGAPRMVMPKNKLDKKWYALIWIALVFASLFRNAYTMYSAFLLSDFSSATKVLAFVFSNLLSQGALPALLCYLCASIVFSKVWRKRVTFSSRNDFLYITMIFVAVARCLIGFIEIFCILSPAMSIYTSMLLDVTVLSIALLLEFFFVLKPRYMNDKTAFQTYSICSSIYLVVQGLLTLLPSFGVFILSNGKKFLPDQYLQTLETLIGSTLLTSKAAVNASIIAIVVFVVVCIVTLVLGELLRKRAKNFVDTTEPQVDQNSPFGNGQNNFNNGNPFGGNGYGGNTNNGNGYGGDNNGGNGNYGSGNANNGNPFGDFPFPDVATKNKEENVFDEFDI